MRIGLTGGIGTGKSTVSKLFKELGLPVLDADAISRKQLEIHGGCYDAAIALFGTGILRDDGSIDRKAVADIVFSDADKREALNGLIHPAVWKEMDNEANHLERKNHRQPIIFDVPLLIESGWHQKMDLVVLVTCPQELVLKRVMERDGADRESVFARMNAQMPQEIKRQYAHMIIDNGGTLEDLTRQVDAVYRRIINAL